MAETTYTYSIEDDMPNGAVNIVTLQDEIQASAIVTAIARIQTNPDGDDEDQLDIVFKDALSTGDKTILDGDTADPAGGLLAAHDNASSSQTDIVHINDVDGPENSIRVYPAPNREGYYLCDRDIKLYTTKITSGDSIEDYKVNYSTFVQEDWNEASLVGCYKDDGQGGYEACADQTDADSNACLSVWDFHPHDQSVDQNPINYDLKGGALALVNGLQGDANDKHLHRIYATVAPNIPISMGGGVRFFDGYMEPYEDSGEMSSINPLAVFLSTDLSTEATKLRLFIYYPAGVLQTYIFRVIMFRPLGTF